MVIAPLPVIGLPPALLPTLACLSLAEALPPAFLLCRPAESRPRPPSAVGFDADTEAEAEAGVAVLVLGRFPPGERVLLWTVRCAGFAKVWCDCFREGAAGCLTATCTPSCGVSVVRLPLAPSISRLSACPSFFTCSAPRFASFSSFLPVREEGSWIPAATCYCPYDAGLVADGDLPGPASELEPVAGLVGRERLPACPPKSLGTAEAAALDRAASSCASEEVPMVADACESI